MSEVERTENDAQQAEEGGLLEEYAPPSSSRRPLGIGIAFLGLLMALGGCVCGPLTAASPLNDLGGPSVQTIQRGLAIVVLGLGLGIALAVAGRKLWQGAPSRPFRPRRTWPLWIALLLLLPTGLLISFLDTGSIYLLPLINTLTMLLLPALVLAIVGRLLRGTGGTWRDVLGGLVGGATLGASLAMFLEVIAAIIALLMAISLGLIPIGLEDLQSLTQKLPQSDLLSNPQALVEQLTPTVVLVVLIIIAVIAPLLEEIAKTLGVGLIGLRLRPTPARAFLMGVASGGGFALAENLLNSAILSSLWAPGVISRLAATLLHCATGGLAGWGWGELWRGRPGRFFVAFAGAIGLHGLWNGLAVGIAVSGLVTAAQPNDPSRLMTGGLVTLALGALLLVVLGATVGGVLWFTRTLARQEEMGESGA